MVVGKYPAWELTLGRCPHDLFPNRQRQGWIDEQNLSDPIARIQVSGSPGAESSHVKR